MNDQIKTRKLSLNTNFGDKTNQLHSPTTPPNPIQPQIPQNNNFHLEQVKVAQNAKQLLQQISQDDPINYQINPQLNPQKQQRWSNNHYQWLQQSPIKQTQTKSKSSFSKPIPQETTNNKNINSLAKFIKKSKLSKTYHDHNLKKPKNKQVLHQDITQLIKTKKIKNQQKLYTNKNCFTQNITVIPQPNKINKNQSTNFCNSYTIPTTYIQMPMGYMNSKNKWVTLNKTITKRVHTSIGFKNQQNGSKFFNVKQLNQTRKTTLKKYSTNSEQFEKINQKHFFSKTSPIKVEMQKLRKLIIGQHSYFDISQRCQINIRGLTRSKTES